VWRNTDFCFCTDIFGNSYSAFFMFYLKIIFIIIFLRIHADCD
jgi:hypothetical protein